MKDILVAFEQRLLLLPTLPDPPPISWPNVDYRPNLAVTGFYLRPTLAPIAPVQGSLGEEGYMRHSGIYQVDVFTRRNVGSYLAADWADKLRDHFSEGTTFGPQGVNIRITRAGRLAAREEADVFWLPVSIHYYCYLRL